MTALIATPDVPDGSILKVLGLLPNGTTAGTLTYDELGAYLSKHYGLDTEKERNARHILRDELFHDGGDAFMGKLLDEQFTDPDVRRLRKNFIPYAKFNNAIKRIVNELSTVYAEPAKRTVATGDDKYQTLLADCWFDEQMLQMSRLLNLHRAVLVGFRIKLKVDGTRVPIVSIATPGIVRAVLHPNDSTEVIGWLIRTNYRTHSRAAVANDPTTPAWTLWTDVESMFLNEALQVIPGSYQEHGLGVNPWVPVTLEPPCPGFWPGRDGEDLVAAHVAIWFANILQLKETKSATKVPVITGDGSMMARGQAADTEVPTELADGQGLTTVDLSMDTKPFRDTADHVLENCGHNYGIAPAVMQHAGVQSAQARELLRMPLKERRKHQQSPLRRFEQRFVIVMSKVCAKDDPDRKFEPDGFRVEFAEPELQLSPSDEHNLYLARRAAGLDSTIKFIQRLHPGMSREDALIFMNENIDDEEMRILAMKAQMVASGEAGGGNQNGGGAPMSPAPAAAPSSDITTELVPAEQ